jgi:hypothetical protein
VGKAKTEAEQLEREDEERSLPLAVGGVVRRLCAYFQCPIDQIRFVDTQANVVTGMLQESVPAIRFNAAKGRHYLYLEIGIEDQPVHERYPIWLRLEFVPLKHGGFEFHVCPAIFRLPDEEEAFFHHVANAINQELRKGYTPGPKRSGF